MFTFFKFWLGFAQCECCPAKADFLLGPCLGSRPLNQRCWVSCHPFPASALCALLAASALLGGGGGGRCVAGAAAVACRVSVPPPGFKPRPLAVKMQGPSHWTTREVLEPLLKLYFWYYFLIVFFLIPDIISWHFPYVKNAQSFWSSSPMTKRCLLLGFYFGGAVMSSIKYPLHTKVWTLQSWTDSVVEK